MLVEHCFFSNDVMGIISVKVWETIKVTNNLIQSLACYHIRKYVGDSALRNLLCELCYCSNHSTYGIKPENY